MTGKARKDLAGRMQQAAGRSSATSAETVDVARPVPPALRSKPVRLSVDLAPAAYRRLITFCQDSAETLGVARVNGVDVLRALLVELDQDSDLVARVRNRLAE